MSRVAVLIPCYNEEQTISKVVSDFRGELPDAAIYVYDNNSTDNTALEAENSGARVVKSPRQGKGSVVRQMFLEVDADIYVLVDGDDTYPAEFVHNLIAPVAEGACDMSCGDRLSNGTYYRQNKRPFHSFGNNITLGLINLLFRSNLKDIMTGYRAFSRIFVKTVPILSDGFQIETELTLHALDKRWKMNESPIDYRDRPEGSFSKLNTAQDGIKVIGTIIKLFKDYKPLPFFGLCSLVFLILGLLSGLPVILEFIATKYITHVPLALLAIGLVVLSALSLSVGFILDTITTANRRQYELYLQNYRLQEISAQSREKQGDASV